MPNPLLYAQDTPDAGNALQQWQPSTWQVGMPGTSPRADMSSVPMPSPDQIEQQRQMIYVRLKQHGYQPVQLSDQQVLATMAPLPQGPVKWPPWVEAFFAKNPQYAPEAATGAARPGIDLPYDQTYQEWNLSNPALSPGTPTAVGSAYDMYPRTALIYRYGNPAVEAMDQANLRSMLDPRGTYDIRTDYLRGAAPNFGGPGGASADAADRAVIDPQLYSRPGKWQ